MAFHFISLEFCWVDTTVNGALLGFAVLENSFRGFNSFLRSFPKLYRAQTSFPKELDRIKTHTHTHTHT